MENIPRNRKTEHQFNAYIGSYLSFWNYLNTYKTAFDVLMDRVYQSGYHIDHLAYPILFIARHCIELGFKANIRHFLKYSEKDDFKKAGTHDLEKLFNAFKLHINETIVNLEKNYNIKIDKDDIVEFNKYCEEVDKLKKIFNSLDKNSDSFRYPVDKNNNRSFKFDDTINLLDVKDLFEKSMILLTYTSNLFEKYTSFADEKEATFVDEIYKEEEATLPKFQTLIKIYHYIRRKANVIMTMVKTYRGN